jgi:Flp pilus assembly protein TadB
MGFLRILYIIQFFRFSNISRKRQRYVYKLGMSKLCNKLFVFILCSVSFIGCVVLCAVFRLIVVLFCVMCVICLLCLIVNHCHQVKTHLQLINITLQAAGA